MSLELNGVIPILPTPFTSEGALDDAGFVYLIETAIESGVDGLAMFGLASEYYKLSDLERIRLVKILVRQVDKRCPIVVSVVPHSTKLAVAEAISAVEAGADAIMIVPPFFLEPPLETIVCHIHDVAEAVSVPVIVQYAPLQTARTIDAEVFAKLCRQRQNIRRIKVDLVPSGPTISSLRSHEVRSLVGYMGLHLPEDFSRGVSGVMPTVSTCPAFVKMWRLLSEDEHQARALHREILPLLNFMMQSVEFLIACEKQLLVDRGVLRSSYSREPSVRLDSVQSSELKLHCHRLAIWLAHGQFN